MIEETITARLPLLPLAAFEDIATLLRGKRIWFTIGVGNAGDALIHAGAHCLFRKIETQLVDRATLPDFLVWGGGGNIGTLWPASYRRRQREFAEATARGIPIIVLPQSATNSAEQMPANTQFFARETSTLALYSGSRLAPDLALAFDEDVSEHANRTPPFPLGIFLRHDVESSGLVDLQLSVADPPKVASTYFDYFRLASDYAAIVTDRLHFAIAALILGRRTVLLPNSYCKNVGVYHAWLRELGCGWGVDAMNALISEHGYNPEPLRKHCENRHQTTKR